MVLNFHSFFIVIIFSLFINLFLIYISNKYKVAIDICKSSKHKIHSKNVPRIGGGGIYFAFILSSYLLDFDRTTLYKIFMIFSTIIFFIGFVEDIRRNLSAYLRLILVVIVVFISIFYFGEDAIISDIGFELPFLLSIGFTIFAVAGVINAFNISDGLNGLSSGISLIAIFYLIMISHENLCYDVFNFLLILTGAIIGFFIINFFTGSIFLGDGGGYLIGYFVAMASVILSNKLKSQVSPYFFLVLVQYPVFDTLFAMYRRKFVSRKNMFSPDILHMHTLLYKRIFKNQWKTTVFLLIISFIFSYFAYLYKHSTGFLISLFLIFCFIYVYSYVRIVNFNMAK